MHKWLKGPKFPTYIDKLLSFLRRLIYYRSKEWLKMYIQENHFIKHVRISEGNWKAIKYCMFCKF